MGPLDWNMTTADFLSFAKTLYHFTKSQLAELEALYPPSNFPRTVPVNHYDLPYSPGWWASIRAATDQDMGCPSRRGAKWFASSGTEGVWLYHFARPRNGSATVAHGNELTYIWSDLPNLEPPTGTPGDVALSSSM